MKALVIEDSRLAREGLIRMLANYPAINVVGAAPDADSARLLIEEHRPGVLFLDIHMPGENGFDLLKTVGYEPKIVFTTAYSEYAIDSFEYNTVDYLLKPVSESRLAMAVVKLTDHAPRESQEHAPLTLDSRIFIKDGGRCHLVWVASIDLIESCKNYVRLHFVSQVAFVKKPLNQVEQRLPSQHFFRANRQFIVNLNSIAAIELAANEGCEILMQNGVMVEVSRRNAMRLKELLSF